MRGKAARQATMLTAITPDALVPPRHPIRRIKPPVDLALTQLLPPWTGCTPTKAGRRYHRSTC